MSVSQRSYCITNSELDNVLDKIGPLNWEEVDKLGETMQTQDMRDSIFADITDPVIALRKLLEYTITHSCLTSTDLIRSLAIMKKLLAAYMIWYHHSSSLKDQPVLLPQLLRYLDDVSINDLPFPGLQLDISKEELYRSDYQSHPNRTKIVIWDYWLKQSYKTLGKTVYWKEVITAVDNSGHKELAVKMWKYNIYCYVLSRSLCTIPDDLIDDNYVIGYRSPYKKPTLADLLTELININLDLFLLGVGLKVPVDVLSQIEEECGGYFDTKYRRKVCEYWLNHCPDDTWGEVIVILMRTGYAKTFTLELKLKLRKRIVEDGYRMFNPTLISQVNPSEVGEKLMIQDMMFLIPSCLDMNLLGVHFNVPSSVLDKIDRKDIEKSHLEFFEHLLSTNPSLTWSDIADVLIKMKRTDLVLTLKDNYGIPVNQLSTQGTRDLFNEECRKGARKQEREFKLKASKEKKDKETKKQSLEEELKTKDMKILELENITTKSEMQEKMLSAKTLEIETLQKELSNCKEELLKYKTKHSHVMKPVVQLDIVQHLPKLEVVLEPVQDNWEQLGVSLGIDHSILSSIKSTTGDSTKYMRQLLEKWSMEGGQLQDLEEGLTSIGRKDLVSGLHQMIDMSEVSADATDTRLSDNKLSMVEKEIQTESTELLDKSVQFDYLTDTLRGVHVGDKNLFLIQGDCPQSFNWEEYGLRVSVPQGTLPLSEICKMSVTALIGGQFTFPKGTELISVVYSVSIAKPLLKPVKLGIQHCAHLVTQDHTTYLSFVIASSRQPVLPYQFQLLKGGQFYPDNRYGSISLSHFCLLGIIKSLFCPIGMLLSSDNTSSDITSTVITSQPSVSESQEIIISSDDYETTPDGPVTQTSTNKAQLISLTEDIQISSLSSSSNDQSTLMEETPTPGLELSPQSSLATPKIHYPVTNPVQDQSPVGSSSPDNMYVGQVVYEVKEHNCKWLMSFIVGKQLDALLKYIEESLSSNAERDTCYVSFEFQNANDSYIELVFGEEPIYLGNGWSIQPHIYPTRIYKKNVDRFGIQSSPRFPSCEFVVFVEQSPHTSRKINYNIPLQGVEPNDMKICMFCSLSSTGSNVAMSFSSNNKETKTRGLPSTPLQYEDKVKKVFRAHFAEFSRLVSSSTNRQSIAPELYSACLIPESCYDEVVDSSSKTDAEKGLSLMKAIKSTIHGQPLLFKTLITVLENVEVFAILAEKLKQDYLQ